MNASRLALFSTAIAMVLWFNALPASGQAKTQEEQYAALATTRTQAELACRKTIPALDVNKNGVADARNAIGEAHSKTATTYQRAIQAEQAKPDTDRNQQLIEELNALYQQAEQDWQTYSHDQEKINASYNEATNLAQTARQVYDSLTNLERVWKDANMDLSVLGADYEQVTNTANTAIANGEKVVNDLKDRQKDWESKLDAAAKKTGIKL